MSNTDLTKTGGASASAKITPLEPLCRAHKLAAYWDVSRRTVELWAAQKRIPSIKLGSALRFRFSEAVAAMEGGSK